MIFNSIEYLFFLPLVYLVYLRLNHRGQNIWLLIASYVFYGWWDVRFLFLITISTSVDYFCGKLIDQGKIDKNDVVQGLGFLATSAILFLWLLNSTNRENPTLILLALGAVILLAVFLLVSKQFLSTMKEDKRKKVVLIVSMCTNLGLLGVFKYFNFFIESAETALMSLGMSEASLTHLDIILPVGISFYTFQTMSYTIDIYRGKLKPCNKFLDFALFVSFFPQLVAGPIERATNLLPRISQKRIVSLENFASGLGLIFYGLFKKIVIADGLAASVAAVYGSSGSVTWLEIVFATLCFTVQIYCDFSGYSDVARGTSRLLGIELMRNFNLPYFSRSPSEFWQRWHISLSSWLRDYLYISLGGNRSGKLMTYRNLMLTMLLGGLWHGAAWNFVLWGAFQGGILCLYRVIGFDTKSTDVLTLKNAFMFFGTMAVFFVFTCYGWMLFRAESLQQVIQYTEILFTQFSLVGNNLRLPSLATLVGLLVLIGYELTSYTKERRGLSDVPLQNRSNLTLASHSLLYGLMLMTFAGALSTPPVDFIYFQF